MNSAYGSYSQPRLVELHMTCEHVACLDWFVSFMGTSKVRSILVDERQWVQVSFKTVVADLPILGLGERQVRRKFEDLVDSGVLSKRVDGKQATYFRINDSVYLSLFQPVTPVTNVCHPCQTNDTGDKQEGVSCDTHDIRMTPMSNDCHPCHTNGGNSTTDCEEMSKKYGKTLFPAEDSPKERIIQTPTRAIYPHVSKETLPPRAVPQKKFFKPTVEEVAGYCRERNNGIDAQSFVDFYESKGWLVGKTPMKDWKAAVRTWERRDGRDGGTVRRDERKLGSVSVWDDYARSHGGLA